MIVQSIELTRGVARPSVCVHLGSRLFRLPSWLAALLLFF